MEILVPFLRTGSILTIALVVLIFPVYGQISTPCSPSILSSFTPCMSFLTNSSTNGTSPTSDCCNSLKTLTSNGMDCLCLVVTGSVPFQIPINRSLAFSLPRACNMPGVPVQCKANAAPLPAPAPASLVPNPSPGGVSPSASPTGFIVPEPTPSALPPESSTTIPPSSVDTEAPTSTDGIRPVLTPSAALPPYTLSPPLLIFALGLLLFSNY